MQTVTSFINMKGGVGKTTLCINIGYTLYKHFNKKVLIIDMDPQFNSTQSLFTKFSSLEGYVEIRDEGKTINHLLQPPRSRVASSLEDFSIKDIIFTLATDSSKSLDIIPGDLELISFESSQRGSEKVLAEIVEEQIANEYDYDFILIDTPATYSVYSQSALLASDNYIIPIAPDIFSGLGYSLLKQVMENDRALKDKEVEKLGIVFTLDKPNRVGRNDIKDFFSSNETFINSMQEYERIRTGNIQTFLYDMETTKNDIINITTEYIEKLNS